MGAEFYIVSEYTEHIAPSEGNDGVLTVSVTADPDMDGYVYLLDTIDGMTPISLTGVENVPAGAQLEQIMLGEAAAFRLKASDASSPVSLTASFSCPGFYDKEAEADDTGSPSIPVSHKFTNLFDTQIGKYSVTVLIPENNEIVKVSTPSKYVDYKLDIKDGRRSVSTSKSKLAPAGTVTLSMSYGKPLASKGYGKVLIWAFCLAIGGAVFYARLPKKERVKTR